MNQKLEDIRILRKTEKIFYLLALILAPIVLYLNFSNVLPPPKENFFVFYTGFVFGELRYWGSEILWIAYAALGVYLIVNLLMVRFNRRELEEKMPLKHFEDEIKKSLRELALGVRITIPIVLNFFLISYLIEFIDVFNKNRLIDLKLLAADFWLTGAYPFIHFAMANPPIWFVKTVEFSFLNLTSILLISAIIIFFKSKKVFSQYALAFILSILIMIPLWLLVPAMSPQDRFIDNVYNLPDPPNVSSALKSFPPIPEMKNFFSKVRDIKKDLDVAPTTTFPSAHAAWAAIAFIYLVEAVPVVAAFFAPFLILSTFGTFYLAQHYFVDAPAGIIMGIVAVFLVNLLFRRRGW